MACIPYSQHTRLMPVHQTSDSFIARPFLFYPYGSPYIIYEFFCCIVIIGFLPISTVTGIFPAKLAALCQPSNSACGLVTANNLPFPWKRVFFTHNLPLCLFCGLKKQKISLHGLKGLERRERNDLASAEGVYSLCRA